MKIEKYNEYYLLQRYLWLNIHDIQKMSDFEINACVSEIKKLIKE